jgi:hypothetical protein
MAEDHRSTPFDRMLFPVDAVVQHVVSRIDVNAILEQIDINAVLDEIDVNELIRRVDLEAIVERSVRRATRRTLELARQFVAELDERVTDIVDGLFRRPTGWRPLRPPSAAASSTQ